MAEQSGTLGDDILVGTFDKDLIFGLGGSDTIRGGDGSDNLFGGAGADTLFGEERGDDLYGGTGADTLFGGYGNDSLYGGDGRDRLLGGDAEDSLFGGDGADVIIGGEGADAMTGGAGADRFVFDGSLIGQDRLEAVRDFTDGDKIDLSLIDADRSKPGNQSFKFVEEGAGRVGEIEYYSEDAGASLIGYTGRNETGLFSIFLGSTPRLTAEDLIL